MANAKTSFNTIGSPQATVYIGSQLAGMMQNVQCTEQFTLTPIRGLGDLLVQEFVPTAIDCSFSSSYFFIGFNTPWFKQMLNRYGALEEVINTIRLRPLTFDLVIYRKLATSFNESTRLVTEVDITGETIMKAGECVLESTSFEVATGGIATSNVSGRYRIPMTIA